MIKSMISRVLSIVVAFFVIATPSLSLAAGISLSTAFNDLVGDASGFTPNKPGFYTSGGRGIFTAGGIDMRFKRPTNPTFFSFTPPSISAGCSGISAHFGGFSFINGDQISQMIKQISQGVVAFVAHLILKTLCAICEGVLAMLEHLAQAAAKGTMDACKMGYSLASAAWSAMPSLSNSSTEGGGSFVGPPLPDSTQSVCGSMVTNAGWATDTLAAMDGACKTADGAMSEINKRMKDHLGQAGGPGQRAGAMLAAASQNKLPLGNMTWEILNVVLGPDVPDAADNDKLRATKLIWMNMMGYQIVSEKDPIGVYHPPKIPAKYLYSLIMCGPTPHGVLLPGLPSSVTSTAAAYCKADFGMQSLALYTFDTSGQISGFTNNASSAMAIDDCASDSDMAMGSGNPYERCLNIAVSNVDKYLEGTGLLTQVDTALQKALVYVINDTPFSAWDPKVVTLVQNAPFPLYQMLNVGAVYPAVAGDMLTVSSRLIAEMLAGKFISEFVQQLPRVSAQGVSVDPRLYKSVADALGSMRVLVQENRTNMATLMSIQTALYAQVRELNKSMQQQVMTTQLSGNKSYASAILGAMSGR